MTLGELIAKLERIPGDVVFKEGFGKPISWRGDYCKLAFVPESDVTAGSMLKHALSAVDATFEGYKGGSYTMHLHTECYVARYGGYGGDEDALTSWRWRAMLANAVAPNAREPENITAESKMPARIWAEDEGADKESGQWCLEPYFDAAAYIRADLVEPLVEALRGLVEAKALSGVRDLVAGWNGENRADGPYKERHPSRLGATLPKTNCGDVYALDEAMQRANAALSSGEVGQ